MLSPLSASLYRLQQHLGFLLTRCTPHTAEIYTVTFPKLSLRNDFSGLGAAKSEVHLSSPTGAAAAPTAGELISVSLFLRIFPAFVF
jgi:hypothetical protein